MHLGQPTLERQQSALDTLAEVSRRHLDLSSQRDAAFDQHIILPDSDQALAEQVWAQLQQHNNGMSAGQAGAEDYNMQVPLHDQPLDHAFTSAEFVPPVLQSAQDNLSQSIANLAALDPQLNVQPSFENLDQLIANDIQSDTRPDLRWTTQLTNDSTLR